QAEDGIRDFHVTGVQTCALPISPPSHSNSYPVSKLPPSTLVSLPFFCFTLSTNKDRMLMVSVPLVAYPSISTSGLSNRPLDLSRSEERRVGKECGCAWAAYHRVV